MRRLLEWEVAEPHVPVPSVSLESRGQLSELQINPAGAESGAGAGSRQLYELSPAPWACGCSAPELGLGLAGAPPWSEWGPPIPGSLQVPPPRPVCSVP